MHNLRERLKLSATKGNAVLTNCTENEVFH